MKEKTSKLVIKSICNKWFFMLLMVFIVVIATSMADINAYWALEYLLLEVIIITLVIKFWDDSCK